MLTLKNIGKDYSSGHSVVHALRCVNLVCRPRELIMVIGGNSSGKTTLLNVMGGLLSASRGEIALDGKSTRKYTDRQWSAYRRRVTLVNPEMLLADRTLLENAALGLRLSGQRRGFRREQAMEMLEYFGMAQQAGCYPGQLSSAQRKMAALACALVAEPDVLLLDEPVLGVDAASAKKVAGILRETARHCLVITASRKPIFPESDVRTIHLKDGTVESDSDPCSEHIIGRESGHRTGGLAFGGRFALAMSSLRRRSSHAVGRGIVCFAAAFCAAAVMILTGAMVQHSAAVQKTTLSVYPIRIHSEDLPSGNLQGLYRWLISSQVQNADIEIQPVWDYVPDVFMEDTNKGSLQVNPTEDGTNLWVELPDNPEIRRARYELISGRWPERYDEVVVIQNSFGTCSRKGLESIGIQPDAETGELVAPGYDSLLHTTFRLVLPTDTYYPNADGTWGSLESDPEYMGALLDRVPSLKIVGILQPISNHVLEENEEFIGYTYALTSHISGTIENSDLIIRQAAEPSLDVLTGLPFDIYGHYTLSPEEKAAGILEHIKTLDAQHLRSMYQTLTGRTVPDAEALQALTDTIAAVSLEEAASLYDKYVSSMYSPGSYDENMEQFGLKPISRMTELRLHAISLRARQELSALLDTYSETLNYTDEAETMAASASKYVEGLNRLCVVLFAVTFACALIGVSSVNAVGIRSRRRQWACLRARGLSCAELRWVMLWENGVIAFVPALAGILAAWPLAGVLAGLSGWSALSAYCTLHPWHGGLLAILLTLATVVSGLLSANAVSRSWPAEEI